jgi:6-phosphogluconolactonase (cycloisomerase 2 family)
MKSLLRWLVGIFIMLGTLLLSNCSPYGCRVTFGSSTCSSSSSGSSTFGGGGGGGGGGTGTTAALAYAVDEGGTIDGYTLTSGSSPTFAATADYTAPLVPTNLEGSGMAVAQSQYLYAAFPTGQIYAWTIGNGGSLAAVSGSPFSASFLVGEPAGGLWSMIVNPAGTLLFMVDTSGMSVHVYQIQSGGALSQVTGSPFSVPFFPGNLGTDGQGKYLYVTGDIDTTEVAAFTIGSSGALTTVSGSPFSFPMAQVQGDASGQYLIGIQGSTYGINDLYVFSIAQSGSNAGAISLVSGSPVATTYVPYSFAVQPNSGGTLIYSFSTNSTGYNPIEGYQLDTTNGALSMLNGSPFSGVSNGFWGQFDQSGAYLFVYGDISNGTAGVPYLGALSVASGGTLTQPTSELDLASLGFWAVTDPK